MKIIDKLNKEAKQLEKQSAEKARAVVEIKQSIKKLEMDITVLSAESIKLGKSAAKHYQAAEMLEGE